jgi:hypothetical protein
VKNFECYKFACAIFRFTNNSYFMTQADIQKALDAIERGAAKALKSKEASRQFLIDAGIIKGKKTTRKKRQVK